MKCEHEGNTMSNTTSSLAQASSQIKELRTALATENKRHKEETERISAELAKWQEAGALLLANIGPERVAHGREVIRVRGTWTGSVAQKRLVSHACEEVAAGGGKLKGVFFGLKDYDRFHEQREDHNYGMGPRHGHIVFAIGLLKRDVELTPVEVEDALYYLGNLDAVQKASSDLAPV